MKIQSIRIHRVCIPFKKPFRHASSERTSTDNIVVETQLEDGIFGYGEGLPRNNITEETPAGVLSAFQQINPYIFQQNLNHLSAVTAFLDEEILSQKNFLNDRENNTARCALELSLLDAYCQSFKKTFQDVVFIVLGTSNQAFKMTELYYDGILSLEAMPKTLFDVLKMRLYGFEKLKIKVGTDTAQAVRMVKAVRRVAGGNKDLRIDANEAWTLKQALGIAEALYPLGVTTIEQPLPHSDLRKMKELKRNSPIPMMLDESLCTLNDARKAIEHQLCDLFNIRLSKCGGFINSLRIAQLARQYGLSYQLGCMVGETGILSAAGRQFASLDPNLRYLEGSYDRHLLKDNIIGEDITFSWGGRAPALVGFGLAVHIDPEKLRQYTTESMQLFE